MSEPAKDFLVWVDRLDRMSAIGVADPGAPEPVREMMREDACAVLEIRALLHERDHWLRRFEAAEARVTELQARGTELVLENRQLRRKARLGGAWKRLAQNQRNEMRAMLMNPRATLGPHEVPR